MKIKKSKYVFFYQRKFPIADISILLKNNFEAYELENQILAIPILFGQEVIVSKADFDYLTSLNQNEWTEFDNNYEISHLINYGIILSDENSENAILFKEREDLLEKQQWNIYAALFNFMTKWKGIDVELKDENEGNTTQEDITWMTEKYGVPPSHFHNIPSNNDLKDINLLKNKYDDDFFNALLNRKTTRLFSNEKVPFDKFSTMIYYTFGAIGINHAYKEISIIRKTSPSGGSLHPTEAYILVLNVENVNPGFYHYNVEKNSLTFIKEYSVEEAKNLAYRLMAGQNYATKSGFLVFLSTRYFRNYWKYIKHNAAYLATIRDAAHLCQTFYLLGSHLELGTFTAAINHSDVEEEIGLNPYEEGISMMVGCGIIEKSNQQSPLMPSFENL